MKRGQPLVSLFGTEGNGAEKRRRRDGGIKGRKDDEAEGEEDVVVGKYGGRRGRKGCRIGREQ